MLAARDPEALVEAIIHLGGEAARLRRRIAAREDGEQRLHVVDVRHFGHRAALADIAVTFVFGQPFAEKLVMSAEKMAWARSLVDRLSQGQEGRS